MRIRFPAVVLGCALTLISARGDEVPELTALKNRYDSSLFPTHESLRESYIHELVKLRWKLVREKREGWDLIDWEVASYPAPASLDNKVSAKLLVGQWHSFRHDYRYAADGTWRMTEGGLDYPEATHGTWRVEGNQYFDAGTASTIVLLDSDYFITVVPGEIHPGYERRRPWPWNSPVLKH